MRRGLFFHHRDHVERAADFAQAASGAGRRIAEHRRCAREQKIGEHVRARLIEQMERAGLVSPMGSNGNREVIVPAKESA